MKPFRIVFIVTLTGVVVGGSVYMWQKSKSNTQQSSLNSQIATLQSQKDALEKSTIPAPQDKTTPTQNSSSSNQPAVSNIFDLKTAKVGDKVGTMSIVSIKKAIENNNPLSNDNVRVEFSGQQTISGSYTYSKDGNDFARVEMLDFSTDQVSRSKIPSLTSDPTDEKSYIDRSGISNINEAKKIFGVTAPSATGKATIVLDHYVLFRCDCDGEGNTFSLVSASNVVDDITSWQNFSSKYFTLSFKIPTGFEVVENADNLLISKKPYEKFTASEDTAFLYLTRYGTAYSKEGQKNSYKNYLKDVTESNITIDGATFTKLVGFDNPADSNLYHFGKEVVVLLDKSWIQIVDRPNNKDVDTKLYAENSPTGLGSRILSTFRFNK